jgi:hypothetical protein
MARLDSEDGLEGFNLERINFVEKTINFTDVKNFFAQKVGEAGSIIFKLTVEAEVVDIR